MKRNALIFSMACVLLWWSSWCAKAQNGCVAGTLTNCCQYGAIELGITPTNWLVAVCLGDPVVMSAAAANTIPGKNNIWERFEDCEATNHPCFSVDPILTGGEHVISWNGTNITNSGLSASFIPTNVGCGTITFVGYVTMPHCFTEGRPVVSKDFCVVKFSLEQSPLGFMTTDYNSPMWDVHMNRVTMPAVQIPAGVFDLSQYTITQEIHVHIDFADGTSSDTDIDDGSVPANEPFIDTPYYEGGPASTASSTSFVRYIFTATTTFHSPCGDISISWGFSVSYDSATDTITTLIIEE